MDFLLRLALIFIAIIVVAFMIAGIIWNALEVRIKSFVEFVKTFIQFGK